ncbi:hypothetical protein FACS1894116_02790 [Betaproteobacteria bacterium]|nr:hypothetical protein AGMMS49543_07920 [Betaproteobacteria bacterium]GHT92503.1 hypothetical protein FACS1894116_02790 [Betaproteobacteria bacterium]GHU00688.1 hypothetical protein AGMMS49960_09280 [Betaproteobacteria bacterium]GHU13059.1 hypothetical protein AGMMS50225_22370 [Betaproteobacteria bacterium]GHU17672.1 hypothetical protein AGMMS50243_06290 [Betaproteobacteria bacterium]
MPQHGFPPRNVQRRREIVALAARMMAEDGVADFGFAKRKAARQLGASDTEALPTNAEIEAELRTWQALYHGEELAGRLAIMRHTAARLMRELAPFRPYLCGGVLDGTAGRYAEIELDLFPDSAKEVEIFLLDAGLEFTHRDIRKPLAVAPELVLSLEWDDIPARLSLYPASVERSAPRQGRARLAQLEDLIANT